MTIKSHGKRTGSHDAYQRDRYGLVGAFGHIQRSRSDATGQNKPRVLGLGYHVGSSVSLEAVFAPSTGESVIARPADQYIVPFAAKHGHTTGKGRGIQRVVAEPTVKFCLLHARQSIDFRPDRQRARCQKEVGIPCLQNAIHAIATIDRIVPATTRQDVIATTTDEDVVVQPTIEPHVSRNDARPPQLTSSARLRDTQIQSGQRIVAHLDLQIAATTGSVKQIDARSIGIDFRKKMVVCKIEKNQDVLDGR